MDNRTAAYLRERRKLSGTWNPVPRIIAGAIGALIVVLTPGNPTPIQNATFTFLKGVAGFLLVEAIARAFRFVFVTPKTMYFAAQDEVKKFDGKLQTYATNIKTLDAEHSLLKAQLEKKRKDQAFADALTERYVHAVSDIMNAPEVQKHYDQLTADDWQEWNRREQAWTNEVRQLLVNHGCNSQIVTHFTTIQNFPINPYHHFHYVSSALSMFSERLDRLKNIISDYAETAILKDR